MAKRGASTTGRKTGRANDEYGKGDAKKGTRKVLKGPLYEKREVMWGVEDNRSASKEDRGGKQRVTDC